MDSDGKWVNITIPDVRVFPEYTDTLISVKQMWRDSYVDVLFRDVCAWAVPDASTADGRTLLHFEEYPDLYMWHVVGTANVPPSDFSHTSLPTIGRACTIHRASSTEHVASLPTDEAATAMHRRLHCSAAHLRLLPTC